MKLLVLVLPMVVASPMLEIALRKIPNDYSYKKEYLEVHASEIEALFLGSSHAYFGINPEFVKTENSFNGAHPAQTLPLDLEILKKYADRLKQLKYLVIPIDYISLYGKEAEEPFLKNYIIYYDINAHGNIADHFEIINWREGNKPKQLWNYYVRNKDNISCNKFGWGTTYKSTDQQDLVKRGKIMAKLHTENNNDFVGKNIKCLMEIISIAQAKGVKIIFFTSPAYYTYTDELNPDQLNTTIDTIKQISSSSNNLFYHNFLRDAAFGEGDFWDGNHVNEIGAKKLTLKIDSIMSAIASNKKERM